MPNCEGIILASCSRTTCENALSRDVNIVASTVLSSAMTDGNWQPLEVQLLLRCARTQIDLITADEIEAH
jgi:hypothetical protein